jgi:hypothetical protein
VARTQFSKINLKEYETSRLQDACSAVFADLQSRDIIYGQRLEDIELVAGQDNFIPHKLASQFQFFIVTRKSAAADIYEVDSTTYDTTKFLGLVTSADVTISLWVG